jgi:hypothetical protein
MGSSPSFGSTPRDLRSLAGTGALFGLAFATARRVSRLTLPRKVTRWVILQEARPDALEILRFPIALGLLVGTRFQVLFHSPRRGTFHLSLTVLVHYRSPRVFSLTEWTP